MTVSQPRSAPHLSPDAIMSMFESGARCGPRACVCDDPAPVYTTIYAGQVMPAHSPNQNVTTTHRCPSFSTNGLLYRPQLSYLQQPSTATYQQPPNCLQMATPLFGGPQYVQQPMMPPAPNRMAQFEATHHSIAKNTPPQQPPVPKLPHSCG